MPKNPSILAQLRETLPIDSISQRRDPQTGELVYTVRREFFYRNGLDSAALASWCNKARVVDPKTEHVLAVAVLDHDEVWKPFNGGAPTRKNSHWWVTFVLLETV